MEITIFGFKLSFLLFELGGFMLAIGILANNIPKWIKTILKIVGVIVCITAIMVFKAYN